MKNKLNKPIGFNIAGRLPFYYGWMMVPVAIIAQAVTGVGQTYGVSVFNPSLLETLGISLSALTGAYMFGTLFASLPQAYIGSLMDRFGIRWVMTVVIILLGGACLFFSTVNSLWTLLLGFFLLRLLGQGGLSLLAGNIPAMWFREKLGLVTGIVSGGFSMNCQRRIFNLHGCHSCSFPGVYQPLGLESGLRTAGCPGLDHYAASVGSDIPE